MSEFKHKVRIESVGRANKGFYDNPNTVNCKGLLRTTFIAAPKEYYFLVASKLRN
jgi:hypothetical protein